MNYSLIRLRFDGLAHFGTSDSALSLFTSEDHFYADTLFSALCHTALSLHGIDGLHSLLQQAADGSLLLSDSMPWHRTAHGVDYYLPKPCRTFSRLPQKHEMPQGSRKAMKKLAWIPVRSFSDFWRSIAGEASYQPQPDAFGTLAGRTQAAVSDETDAVPYQVGAYRFFTDCGLFVCADWLQGAASAGLLRRIVYGAWFVRHWRKNQHRLRAFYRRRAESFGRF